MGLDLLKKVTVLGWASAGGGGRGLGRQFCSLLEKPSVWLVRTGRNGLKAIRIS